MGNSAFKILIVEDEILISLYLEDCLSEAGYRVVSATTADQAILLLETDPEIRLVMTDIDMPGSMDGLELAAAVRRRWPPVKLIIASGKYRPGVLDLPPDAVFLPKPFLGQQLLETVRGLPNLF